MKIILMRIREQRLKSGSTSCDQSWERATVTGTRDEFLHRAHGTDGAIRRRLMKAGRQVVLCLLQVPSDLAEAGWVSITRGYMIWSTNRRAPLFGQSC